MLIVESLKMMRQYMSQLHKASKRIALVPTMGSLHDGHMKLIDEAKKYADIIVVSIFVNPIQFNHTDDLSNYPRAIKEDYKKIDARHDVDFVFAPTQMDIYPKGTKEITYVDVSSIPIIFERSDSLHCSLHFRGVTTVVSKLFNLIQPNIAVFGEKDYQQLMLIRKMVADMNYNIDVISIPTVRDKDGLALSSRNIYLTNEQRKIAPNLIKIINMTAENFINSKMDIEKIILLAEKELIKNGFYNNDIQIRDADTLLEATTKSGRVIILITTYLGMVRLVDNRIIELNIN